MIKTTLKQKVGLIVFGIILTIFLLEVGLRFGGWVMLSQMESENQQSNDGKKIYKLLCLGESTTMLGGIHSYPRQLEKILNQNQTDIQFKVINKGISGADSATILFYVESFLDQYKPDYVLTMMGINDTEATPVYVKNNRFHWGRFLKSFRVFKLMTLLNQHMMNRKIEHSMQSVESREVHEEVLKSDIHRYPRNPANYNELGEYYEQARRLNDAETLYKQAILVQPNKAWGYELLGRFFRTQKRYEAAAQNYRQAVAHNSQKTWPYIIFSQHYQAIHAFDLAEDILHQAIKTLPGNKEIFIELIHVMRQQGRFKEAVAMLEQKLNDGWQDKNVFIQLAYAYYGLGNKDQVIYNFKKVYIKDKVAGHFMVDWFLKQNEHELPRKALKELAFENKDSAVYLRALNTLYYRVGGVGEALGSEERSMAFLGDFYPDATKENYRMLAEIVLNHGIPLISIQYPMRSMEPLKSALQSFDGIIFVENESAFKQALNQGGYDDYFEDSFAGDFGHCTAKGNFLLADNIAKAIEQHLRDHQG